MWLYADRVYPGRKFTAYAILGDDIVIGDSAVASVYKQILSDLEKNHSFLNQGFLSSLKKCGFMTFSPISVKMMRSANFSVAWMAVLNHLKCNSLQLSLRMKLGVGWFYFVKTRAF